ncbi:helix-turn-helix domain-containing protein [Streptomyces sp. NPDC001941]|uniref:helix-turn-helix domain-containing protein n=1 Tax=Streptomyces sp. NPDC001941 TaxID=3154659 RepID=UPI0033337053
MSTHEAVRHVVPPRHSVALPPPRRRQQVREAWGLSRQQVAEAFGVTTATVRSWETGQSEPRGARRAAYGRFLAGLGQGPGLGRDFGRGSAPGQRQEPGGATGLWSGARREPDAGPGAPARPVPAQQVRLRVPRALVTGRRPRVPVVAVGGGVDPVSPARHRRLRRCAAATGVWTALLYLWLTAPVSAAAVW